MVPSTNLNSYQTNTEIEKITNMKIYFGKYEFSLTKILRSPNISRAVTCVYGSVEFAVAGETVMMMHEMIVMVVVAGHEDRNGFFVCVVECLFVIVLLELCG